MNLNKILEKLNLSLCVLTFPSLIPKSEAISMNTIRSMYNTCKKWVRDK